MAISRLLARPLLGSIFLYAGYQAVKNPEPLVERARRITDMVGPTAQRQGIPVPSDAALLVRINGATQVTAATALALGKAPRLSALLLASSLVPTTLAGHPFWEETDPAAKKGQKLQFAKNLSVLGGLLLAAVDTEGKPGVAWRARHAATGARRHARSLAKEARLEAKLAAKSIT
ncbi:MAG TPA: DoxX family protein [Marmoricola sp.]|jgi:uncharacterized membrane protein YphA (DoxX/SURF4 family)|nr:DoxX family protein [Marmoricola sp.]